MPGYDVHGKVFFITGGASGIGRGIAEGVLTRHGKVFFMDTQREQGQETQTQLAATYGADNIRFAVGDVTNRNSFEETFNQAVATFGRVDVMLNNAGILGETRPALMIAVNLLGSIYGTEIASAHMRKDHGGKGGRVVNVSSILGFKEFPNTPVYAATKQGIRAYTRSLALSPVLEETGMEYATLHPDGVQTTLFSNMNPGDILFLDLLTKQYDGKYIKMEELVEAFFQLVSLEKMNGAALFVSPGKKTYIKVSAEEIGDTYPPRSKL